MSNSKSSLSNLTTNEKTLLETLRKLKEENQCNEEMLKFLDSLEQKNSTEPKQKTKSFVCNPDTTGSMNKNNQLNDFYNTLFIPDSLSKSEEKIYRTNALMTFFIKYKEPSYRQALSLLKNISEEEKQKSLAFLQEFVNGIDLTTGSSHYVSKFIDSFSKATEEDDKKFEELGTDLTLLVTEIVKETSKNFLEFYACCPHTACVSAKFEASMFASVLTILALFDTIKLKITKDHLKFVFTMILDQMLAIGDVVDLYPLKDWEEPLNFASEENDPVLQKYRSNPLERLISALMTKH